MCTHTFELRQRRNYPSSSDPQRNFRIVIFVRHDVEAEVVEAADGAGEGRRVVEVTADVRFYAVKLNFEARKLVVSGFGDSCERHLSRRLLSCWDETHGTST